MPVRQVFDFDNAVSANMNEAATDITAQLLIVSLQGDMRKFITDVQCSYIRQSNIGGVPADPQTVLANTFIQGRVIVVTGRMTWDGVPINSLLQAMPPIQTLIAREIIPYTRILFDQSFINEGNYSFTIPKEISEGEDCHVIMSQGLAISDSGILISSSKVAHLNVGGYYGEAASAKIPWRLR